MTPIEKKILRHIVKASDEYKLIEDGDKIYGLYVWWQGFICHAAYTTDHPKASTFFNRVARCQFRSRSSWVSCFPSRRVL